MDRRFGPLFLSRRDRVLAGEKLVIPVASPVAGQDWTVTVPGGRQWRLDSLRAILTASAAVASRIPRLSMSDGSTVFWEGGQQVAVTAGLAVRISGSVLGPQSSAVAANVPTLISLPDIVLPSQTVIAFSTLAIDAADQWSAIGLLVEQYWNSDQSLTNRHLAHEFAEQLAAERAGGQTGT